MIEEQLKIKKNNSSNLIYMKLPRFLGSSQDPTKLALKIQGVLLGLIPVILIFASQFDAEWVTSLVKAIVGVISAVMILIGVVRQYKK